MTLNKAVLRFSVFVILLIFISGLTQAGAQEISQWRISVSVDRGGLSLVRGLSDTEIPEPGFSIAAQPVFKINEDLSFVTGLEYTYFNYRFPSIRTSARLLEEIGRPHISYISLPIMLNLHFLENLRSLNFTGGFRISRRLASSNGRFRSTSSDGISEFDHTISKNSNDILLAYTIGTGYRRDFIGIDLMYSQDLTPFIEVVDIRPTNSSSFPTQISQPAWRRSISLKVSYFF